jgi:2'-5' RNA ligase
MSPFPTQMRDRWQNRPEPAHGQGTIYWHILFHDHPQVRALAKKTQDRLSRIGGFHMTPERWLHMTTLVVGSTDEISSEQATEMLTDARKRLSEIDPVTVSLGRVLYHPEAIMLGIRPERALDPILEAVRQATLEATGNAGAVNGSFSSWMPHVTVSYSISRQPAEPIISTLGKEVPGCDVLINAVSLVIQWGPERLWNWELVGTAHLGRAT